MADPKAPPAGPRKRNPLIVFLIVVVAVVVYAYAFDQTKVTLAELGEEARQDRLVLVIRELARPEIFRYERTETNTDTPLYLPCPEGGFESPQPRPDERALIIEPACGEPGVEIEVRGQGFSPHARVNLYHVPPEGDLTFEIGELLADGSGNFVTTVDTRERPNTEQQWIRAVTREPIGSIFSRVEVWQDDNDNGVQDPVLIPESGTFTTALSGRLPEQAGVALLDPGRNPVDFVTLADPFLASGGPARDELAVALDESRAAPVKIVDVAADGTVSLEGPAGTDLSEWSVVAYDAVTGESGETTAVTDSVLMSPRLSRAALDTWDRIIETVFMALLATTLGVVIAVPLSFAAARNLMKDVSTTVTKLALQVIALPIGIGLGLVAAGAGRTISETITDNLFAVIAALVIVPILIRYAVRWAIPPVDVEPPTPVERLLRGLVLVVVAVASVLTLFLLANLLTRTGRSLAADLSTFEFLPKFVANLGDILATLITVTTALISAGVLMGLAGTLGAGIKRRLPDSFVRILDLPLAALAGAGLAALVGAGVGWLYQLSDPVTIYWIPGAIGATIGLALALRAFRKESVGIGLVIYYIARTIFNTLRSIEPLVMVIVVAVWVGIGPFAGTLALAVHTIAALAKLYSEQVESISAGPVEAVKASGATRLQTIVYAVLPQVIPPYISFTLYRWDINVRMSTIIGFAGGGGIGLILQQNIRLLNYKAASVNMFAIAIVVASMDYLSSRIRERIV